MPPNIHAIFVSVNKLNFKVLNLYPIRYYYFLSSNANGRFSKLNISLGRTDRFSARERERGRVHFSTYN